MPSTNPSLSWLLSLACAAPLGAQSLELAAVLRPDLPEDTATFSWGVDIEGPTLAAIAVGPAPLTERAYVYVSTPKGWEEQALLVPDAPMGQGIIRLALGQDCLIGGAPNHDGVAQDAGAAYVFRRSGTGWHEEAMLASPNAQSEDRFGWSVAIEGDWAVVGAAPKNASGFAWVYRHVAGQWYPFERLRSPTVIGTFSFGVSVDLSRTDVLVGAPTHNCDASTFALSPSGFQLDTVLAADFGSDCLGFDASWGEGLSICGDRIVLTDNDDYAPRAELHVYDRQNGAWAQATKLLVSFYGYVTAVDQTDDRILAADRSGGQLLLFAKDPTWKLSDAQVTPPRLAGGTYGSSVALTNRWAATNTTAAGGHVLVYRVVDE